MWQQLFAHYPPSPRVGASVQSSLDGKKLYVFGGASHEEGLHNDMFILDTESMQWRKLDYREKGPAYEGVDIPDARYDHSSIMLTIEGKETLLLFGGSGQSGPLNDVWLFDTVSSTWEKAKTKGAAPLPRTIQHVAKIQVASNQPDTPPKERLYVYGGGAQGDLPVEDHHVYCLDLQSWMWVKVSNPKEQDDYPRVRLGHSLTAYQHLIYLLGGMENDTYYNDVWAFDTKLNTWKRIPTTGPCPMPRAGHCAALVHQDQLYVMGGMNKQGEKAIVLEDIHVLDLKTHTWKTVDHALAVPPGPPGARLDCASCSLTLEPHTRNEQFKEALLQKDQSTQAIFVFGGMDLNGLFNDMFLYHCI